MVISQEPEFIEAMGIEPDRDRVQHLMNSGQEAMRECLAEMDLD
jgi:hypothetical protein